MCIYIIHTCTYIVIHMYPLHTIHMPVFSKQFKIHTSTHTLTYTSPHTHTRCSPAPSYHITRYILYLKDIPTLTTATSPPLITSHEI